MPEPPEVPLLSMMAAIALLATTYDVRSFQGEGADHSYPVEGHSVHVLQMYDAAVSFFAPSNEKQQQQNESEDAGSPHTSCYSCTSSM